MLALELGRAVDISSFTPVAPATYQAYPGRVAPADWWEDVFGVTEDIPQEIIFINNFFQDITNFYSKTFTLQDCLDQPASFFWSESEQLLTVHFDEGESWYTSAYQYEKVQGFTDQDVIYVDDIEYLPLIKAAPSIEQQEDIANYDRLAFVSGSITLDNNGGEFDFLTSEDIYGQGATLKYIDAALVVDQAISRDDLVPLASFYIEDYDPGITELEIRVQDLRKAQNVQIPKQVFKADTYPNIEDKYINKPIPLIYGPIAEWPCVPLNGDSTGDVTFKIAKTVSSIGTVQVFQDDTWNDVTPTSTDLTSGEFVLSQADARKNGDFDGKILDCRVTQCTGETVTDSADVIRLMNLEAGGIEYNGTNYDTTEWTAEKASLSQIGIGLSDQVELFEAIRMVQNGSNIGFRYEIKPDGRRTIRIDGTSRAVVGTVENIDIKNLYTLKPETNSDNLAATVTVNYKRNYSEDLYRVYIDDSQRDTVRKRYRQEPDFNVDTYLQDEELAAERAAYTRDKFSTIPVTVLVQLIGKHWYTLRIYDIIEVELTPGFVDSDSGSVTGRKYYGNWKAQVVSIAPSYRELVNNVRVFLLEEL